MISVSTYPPGSLLSPFVACYTYGVFNTAAAPGTVIEIVPNGCPEVIIHLREQYCQLPGNNGLEDTPDYMLIGLFSRTFKVRFNEAVPVFSIRFKPEALPALFQLEGSAMVDGFEDGDQVFGKAFRTVCERIREEGQVAGMIARAEEFLLSRLAQRSSRRDYVARSAALMRGSACGSVEDISRQVCISQRQLERQFRRLIGITPKQYLKLVRINRVIETLENNADLDLTSIAYHCGYFDQAHFTKDFKRITGELPGDYRKGGRGLIALSF